LSKVTLDTYLRDSPKVKVPSTFLNNPDPSAEPKTKFGLPAKTSSEAM
jgi:hypothetical protein